MVDNFYFVADLALAFWLLIALVERLSQKGERDWGRAKSPQNPSLKQEERLLR
jgi:hypothetical protein